MFSEIKQTWLGFSLEGNAGLGLGTDFAKGLHFGLNTVFKDFGKETVPQSPHMEKLCLISPNVGRDKISDFATKKRTTACRLTAFPLRFKALVCWMATNYGFMGASC